MGNKDNKTTFIVKWQPVDGGTVGVFLTESEDEAIENFKANVRLGHRANIEVMR